MPIDDTFIYLVLFICQMIIIIIITLNLLHIYNS